jgi:hypothetical protein
MNEKKSGFDYVSTSTYVMKRIGNIVFVLSNVIDIVIHNFVLFKNAVDLTLLLQTLL